MIDQKFHQLLCPLLMLMMSLSAASANAADFVIDTRGGHAAITFKYKHLGISWLTGHFKTFSGEFSFDEADVEASAISVDIDVTSLDSNHSERDKHIRSSKYLNTDKFPDAKFVSSRVVDGGDGRATVIGDFTFMGVTSEIEIEAEITGEGNDPWGGYRVGFSGTTTLDMTQYGVRMPPTNEVELGLFIEGVRKR
jgi:polyisoprenoid-binding protein YceI